LREALHRDVKAKVDLEINKDVTKSPREIEQHIFWSTARRSAAATPFSELGAAANPHVASGFMRRLI
jgi:hypothetical protein